MTPSLETRKLMFTLILPEPGEVPDRDRSISGAEGGIVVPWGSPDEVAFPLSGFQPCVHGAGDERHGLAGKNAGTPRALPAPPPWQPRGRRLAGASTGKAPPSMGAQ